MQRASGSEDSARQSTTVRHAGALGTLSCNAEALCYDAMDATTAQAVLPCLGCKTLPVKVFPWPEVVGATLEGSTGLRVWHCAPKQSGSGLTARTIQRLKKSDVFHCNSHEEATVLVKHIQRTAAWGGRDTAPRVMVVVNPVSGPGKGLDVFNSSVLPVLRDAAGMSVDIHITSGRGHASQITREQDLSQVSVIIYVGGDGTVFEGLQGIMSRSDWASVVQIPFATVPSGSGNGMSASMGLWDPVTAAHAVCKRHVHALDVASALQPPNSRYYLVLSVAYGLMANLDIGTEHLRWMGEARFSVGGLKEILSGRTYPVQVALLRATDNTAQNTSNPHKPDNGRAQVLGMTEDTMTQSLLGPDRTHSQDTVASPTQPTAPHTVTPHEHSLHDYPAGPPLPLLSAWGGSLPSQVPSHPSDLPQGWEMVPEQAMRKAQYWMLKNTTHLALNAPLNPRAHCADGAWELMYVSGIQGAAGKVKGIQFLLNTESGTHVDMDMVHTIKWQALALQPLAGDSTWLVLDGEEVPRDRPVFLEFHALQTAQWSWEAEEEKMVGKSRSEIDCLYGGDVFDVQTLQLASLGSVALLGKHMIFLG